MGYFAPVITRYLDESESTSPLQGGRDLCLCILKEYGIAALRETARIVYARNSDSKEIGSIVGLASQSMDLFRVSSFRRIHWRVEWHSGSSSQFDVIPCFKIPENISVQFDMLDETRARSAEADFKSVARRVVEKYNDCLFVSSDGYYGDPAVIYFDVMHCRKGDSGIAGALPVFGEFRKWFSGRLPTAPVMIKVPISKIDKWFEEVTAKLGVSL